MSRKFSMPKSKIGRIVLGTLLVVGGILGFLPVLGFWMIPLGLIVLSQDFASVRRLRRRWTVKLLPIWKRWQKKWKKDRPH